MCWDWKWRRGLDRQGVVLRLHLGQAVLVAGELALGRVQLALAAEGAPAALAAELVVLQLLAVAPEAAQANLLLGAGVAGEHGGHPGFERGNLVGEGADFGRVGRGFIGLQRGRAGSGRDAELNAFNVLLGIGLHGVAVGAGEQ